MSLCDRIFSLLLDIILIVLDSLQHEPGQYWGPHPPSPTQHSAVAIGSWLTREIANHFCCAGCIHSLKFAHLNEVLNLLTVEYLPVSNTCCTFYFKIKTSIQGVYLDACCPFLKNMSPDV